MIAKELLNPKSIAVIGASGDTQKPGGSILRNLLTSNFRQKSSRLHRIPTMPDRLPTADRTAGSWGFSRFFTNSRKSN